MPKFHIDKNGAPRQCQAEKRACPYGDENHYPTREAAAQALMSDRVGVPAVSDNSVLFAQVARHQYPTVGTDILEKAHRAFAVRRGWGDEKLDVALKSLTSNKLTVSSENIVRMGMVIEERLKKPTPGDVKVLGKLRDERSGNANPKTDENVSRLRRDFDDLAD